MIKWNFFFFLCSFFIYLWMTTQNACFLWNLGEIHYIWAFLLGNIVSYMLYLTCISLCVHMFVHRLQWRIWQFLKTSNKSNEILKTMVLLKWEQLPNSLFIQQKIINEFRKQLNYNWPVLNRDRYWLLKKIPSFFISIY